MNDTTVVRNDWKLFGNWCIFCKWRIRINTPREVCFKGVCCSSVVLSVEQEYILCIDIERCFVCCELIMTIEWILSANNLSTFGTLSGDVNWLWYRKNFTLVTNCNVAWCEMMQEIIEVTRYKNLWRLNSRDLLK